MHTLFERDPILQKIVKWETSLPVGLCGKIAVKELVVQIANAEVNPVRSNAINRLDGGRLTSNGVQK